MSRPAGGKFAITCQYRLPESVYKQCRELFALLSHSALAEEVKSNESRWQAASTQ